MGSLGETMKKIIVLLFFLCGISSIHAKQTVEDLKREVVQGLPSILGWCSKEKALSFIDLVLEVKPQVYVEIGVFGGSSVFPVASALKFMRQGVIIAIDPWDKFEAIRHFDPMNDEIHLAWWSNLNFEYIYHSYLNVLRKYALEDYCVTIRATAENAASKVGVIDILYMDGSPGEDAFSQDVTLYLPKVRSGGYIWVNDCLGANRQTGLDILMEFCEPVQVMDSGTCVLFKKKG